jgi:hypothetical protein
MTSGDVDEFAAELLGTYVLAGVTTVDHAGNILERRQFHGMVVRASVAEGVIVADAEGLEHWLPLDRSAFRPADPGHYRLRSTGEVVVDPAWLTTWTVHPPERH